MQTLAEFLGGLVTPQGRLAGQPLHIFPWQFKVVDALDGPGDLAVSMARANGKTHFSVVLSTATLVGPLMQRAAETLVVASSFEQGLILYRHTLAMLEPWIEDDTKRWKVNNSTNRASIVDKRTGAGLFVLGSDARRLAWSRADTGAWPMNLHSGLKDNATR